MGKGLSENRQKLVEKHMDLVEQALRRHPGTRMDEDLRAAGRLGLCRAAALWREGGEEFPPYARRLIAEEIGACLQNSRPTAGWRPVPEPAAEDAGYRRVEERMLLAGMDAVLPALVERRAALAGRMLLRGTSVAGIAGRMGLSRREVRRMLRRAARALLQWENGPAKGAAGKDGTDGRDPMD